MKKLLQKIEWKTNGWDYKLSILNIHLHSSFVYWGLELMTFEIQSKEYSLIRLGSSYSELSACQSAIK